MDSHVLFEPMAQSGRPAWSVGRGVSAFSVVFVAGAVGFAGLAVVLIGMMMPASQISQLERILMVGLGVATALISGVGLARPTVARRWWATLLAVAALAIGLFIWAQNPPVS